MPYGARGNLHATNLRSANDQEALHVLQDDQHQPGLRSGCSTANEVSATRGRNIVARRHRRAQAPPQNARTQREAAATRHREPRLHLSKPC